MTKKEFTKAIKNYFKEEIKYSKDKIVDISFDMDDFIQPWDYVMVQVIRVNKHHLAYKQTWFYNKETKEIEFFKMSDFI